MKQWLAKGLQDMPSVASEIAQLISPGKPILVEAQMGSGKTTFAKFLVEALGGLESEVSSPTFSIIQTYDIAKGLKFHHVDLYRIKDVEEFYDLDMEPYLSENAYLYIEWPQLFLDAFDMPHTQITINKNQGLRDLSLF